MGAPVRVKVEIIEEGHLGDITPVCVHGIGIEYDEWVGREVGTMGKDDLPAIGGELRGHVAELVQSPRPHPRQARAVGPDGVQLLLPILANVVVRRDEDLPPIGRLGGGAGIEIPRRDAMSVRAVHVTNEDRLMAHRLC